MNENQDMDPNVLKLWWHIFEKVKLWEKNFFAHKYVVIYVYELANDVQTLYYFDKLRIWL